MEVLHQLIPESLSLPVAVFLLASSTITSMITASLGAGGGVLLLVLMASWMPPAAIIPVHGMIQLGSNVGRAALTWRHVDWRVIAAFLPGVMVGAALGAWLLVNLPAHIWQLTIALFVLYLCWGPALPKGAFGAPGVFVASALTSFVSLFVGATGLGRVVQRTCDVMISHDTDDVRRFGVIDLPTLQKYINFHYAVSLDLFGAEASTNGANFYAAGLKGRFDESAYDDDHVLASTTFACTEVADGAMVTVERPSLQVVNLQLRDAYSEDCAKGLRRWNRSIAEAGVDFELTLPHPGFNRSVGTFAPHHISPDGRILGKDEWAARRGSWLPTDDDRDYVISLMSPVYEPGRMAGWIAPPARGINTRPVEYDYVRL